MESQKLKIITDLITSKKPFIMGILNITPDSFSDGGKYFQIEYAVQQAEKLIREGVDIIDIGGESTRPGAEYVSEEEELRRVIPAIKQCKDAVNHISNKHILISIDTYKANVAQLALIAGADLINDVSGLTMDPNMVHVAAKLNCPIVIMHNEGIPATKPDCKDGSVTHLADVLQKIYSWLKDQTQYAINNGAKKENIIIDPGLGFGKTAEEDLYLIENLREFRSLGFPILAGLSRKSFIKKIFPNDNLEIRSKEIIELAIKNGADIIRVHSAL